MRRISVFVVGLIVAAVILPLAGIAAETQKEIPLDASEQVILRLLSQPTTDAVYDYYGAYRQYWRQEILGIQKVPQSPYYEVITRVETFYGAHNPPYGLDTMTFYIDPVGTAQLISFDHYDEPDYVDAVQWVVRNGITTGTGGNCFCPEANCTRAQAVTFLYCYYAD